MRFNRRPLQFSLRGLALAIVICACAFALIARVSHCAREQANAVATIEAAFGQVIYDYEDKGTGIYDPGQRLAKPGWLGCTFGKDVFHGVVWANLDSPEVTDSTLQSLQKCPDLRILHISHAAITNEGLSNLIGLKKLRTMTIYAPDLDANGLAILGHLAAIEDLEVHEAKISDKDLKHLKETKTLKRLFFGFTDVTEAGINDLRKALPDCTIEHDPWWPQQGH